jgi:hypothetical protein
MENDEDIKISEMAQAAQDKGTYFDIDDHTNMTDVSYHRNQYYPVNALRISLLTEGEGITFKGPQERSPNARLVHHNIIERAMFIGTQKLNGDEILIKIPNYDDPENNPNWRGETCPYHEWNFYFNCLEKLIPYFKAGLVNFGGKLSKKNTTFRKSRAKKLRSFFLAQKNHKKKSKSNKSKSNKSKSNKSRSKKI